MVEDLKKDQSAWGAGKDFASAATRHLRARWSLFAIEGRVAARWAGVMAGLGAAAACSLIVAYLFFALTIGFTIAWLCKAIAGIWVLIMLGTGLAHVGVAVVFALMLKRRLKISVFPLSRAEFKKDFE